jgi:uncharacterized protein YkwD
MKFLVSRVFTILFSVILTLSLSTNILHAQVINESLMATEILAYINQYRAQHGLSKLVMNNSVSSEAYKHSDEMAKRKVAFGHNGFYKRIDNLHKAIKNSSIGAENVAYNYKNAEVVARGWINSSGHRKNILGNYNLTGIGIARDAKGRLYFTQMFLLANSAIKVSKTNKAKFGGFFSLFG